MSPVSFKLKIVTLQVKSQSQPPGQWLFQGMQSKSDDQELSISGNMSGYPLL
jgi:hypothetical protein